MVEYINADSNGDYLTGGLGNKVLVGGGGNDRLAGLSTYIEPGSNGPGSQGPVYMYGNGGADSFSIGFDNQSGLISSNGGTLATVMDYDPSEGDYVQVRGQSVDYFDSLRVYNFLGNDGQHYSNVFFDTDNSGSSDDLVAQVRGDAFISSDNVVNY